MGASVDHLQKHPTTGRLSFRRTFPPDLRPYIPARPRELKRSLGTKNISDSGAMEIFQTAAAQYDQMLAMARKVRDGAFDQLDEPTIAYLAKVFERGLHEGSESSLKEGQGEKAWEGWNWLGGDFRRWRGEQDFDAVEEHWGSSAKRLLANERLLWDPEDCGSFQKLCMALNDAAVATEKPAMARLSGEMVPFPPEPEKPARLDAGPSIGTGFPKIVQSILESPLHKISETTKETTTTALRYFREAFGDLSPEKITRKVVTEWLELLVRKPRDLKPADRKLKIRDLVERYEGQEVRRLSGKTLEQYVTALSARWRQGVRDGLIDESAPNPFSDRKIPQARPPEIKVHYSHTELKALFALPIFTDGERPRGGKDEASYWMPLLLLWTGARPEEIAQLLISDIMLDPRSGRWLLRITDEGEHPHKGARVLKTGESGRRTFPLPQALLDLGLLDYVDHLRDQGVLALFPALRPKGKRRYLYAQWATWWGKHVRAAKVIPVGVERKPMREFRDVWSTAARESGLSREAMEYIQGHTPRGASAHEVYGSKEPLGRRIDDLQFDGLDLSGIRPWSPTAADKVM